MFKDYIGFLVGVAIIILGGVGYTYGFLDEKVSGTLVSVGLGVAGVGLKSGVNKTVDKSVDKSIKKNIRNIIAFDEDVRKHIKNIK